VLPQMETPIIPQYLSACTRHVAKTAAALSTNPRDKQTDLPIPHDRTSYPGTPGTTPSNLENRPALSFGRRMNEHRRHSQPQSRATNAVCDATKDGTYPSSYNNSFRRLGWRSMACCILRVRGCLVLCSIGMEKINPRFEMPGI
jgi:hypothetical protein